MINRRLDVRRLINEVEVTWTTRGTLIQYQSFQAKGKKIVLKLGPFHVLCKPFHLPKNMNICLVLK